MTAPYLAPGIHLPPTRTIGAGAPSLRVKRKATDLTGAPVVNPASTACA